MRAFGGFPPGGRRSFFKSLHRFSILLDPEGRMRLRDRQRPAGRGRGRAHPLRRGSTPIGGTLFWR